MVAGACVAVLAASPGNCLAIWGLIDAEALMPLVDPLAVPVADPVAEIVGWPVTLELERSMDRSRNSAPAQRR